MLKARGLVIRYGPHPAVSDVDLDLAKNEILGLLGPNGAGKTTLLRRLAGLLPGQAGTVELDGADTALGYVTYLAALSGLPRARRKAAAAKALERTGAAKLAPRLVGRLSKGQRQRVALAGAIVHQPDVLLLDEPSEGLDPARWWRCAAFSAT